MGAEDITSKRLLSFYVPLALSWLCMAAEAPICLAVISRSPESSVKAAAFQAVMAIAIFIEAPVIDLLSTSTTLCRSRASLQVMKKFVLWLILLVTVVHAAVVFTPLFDLLTMGLLRLRPEVAEACRVPLQILTLWSAAIGWRRWQQGLLIRAGQTRSISVGTLLRVGTVALCAFWLHFGAGMDGLLASAVGLMASVAVESAYVSWVSREVMEEGFLSEDEGSQLSFKELVQFHLPLTATTSTMLMTGPLLSWALAASPEPVRNAAAFSVASSLVWLFRTSTFALPEVVIALSRDDNSRPKLQRFCLQVGLFFTFLMAVVWAFGLEKQWFLHVLGASEDLIPLASFAFLLSLAFPLINSQMSAYRGFLTASKETTSRLYAILVAMTTLFVSLKAGVGMAAPGILTVSVGLLLGQLAELGTLFWNWRRVSRIRLPQG